jgi:rRNA maturation endonuclease Nob1
MASSGKSKTTMAKLMRETRLREKRMAKEARKDARRLRVANGEDISVEPVAEDGYEREDTTEAEVEDRSSGGPDPT